MCLHSNQRQEPLDGPGGHWTHVGSVCSDVQALRSVSPLEQWAAVQPPGVETVRVRQRCQDPEPTGWVYPGRRTKHLRDGAGYPAPVVEVYTAPPAHTEEAEQ